MKNIELKIILENFSNIVQILKKSGAQFKGKLLQVDTYYNCKNGRLKFREINNKQFELIFYQRPNKTNSKISDYQILNFNKNQARGIENILKKSLGEKVVIKKERNLWIYKNTRIHLDIVEKLGHFLELETVVQGNNLKNARKEHAEIINLLKIGRLKKISVSYSDLLLVK